MVQLSTGDMLRAAVAAGTPSSASRPRRSWTRASWSPTRSSSASSPSGSTSRTSGGGFILDGFPRTCPGRGARLPCCAEKGHEARRRDRAEGRRRGAGGAHRRPLRLREMRRRLSRPLQAPTVAGVCDRCGSTEFRRRPDDNAETMRTRLDGLSPRDGAARRLLSAPGAGCAPVDGMADIERGQPGRSTHVLAAVASRRGLQAVDEQAFRVLICRRQS